MYFARIDKNDLLNWLGRQSQPLSKRVSVEQLREPLNGKIGLLWKEKPSPGNISAIVSVDQADMVDFYAFVGTYVATYRPFSAFFHVAAHHQLQKLLADFELKDRRRRFPEELIGVAITEAYTQARGKIKTLGELTVSSVLGTLSATLYSAIRQGYSSSELDDITDRWKKARRLNSGDQLALEPDKICEVWSILADAFSFDIFPGVAPQSVRYDISLAVRAALTGDSDISEWVQRLASRIPPLGNIALKMQGSREERVRSLAEAMTVLTTSEASPLLKDFVAGSLISMIGNGSFDYLPLLSSLAADLPSAALWFAIASYIQRSTDALTVGDCLGRRSARDAFRTGDFFSGPRDDIALEEFEVISRTNKDRLGFRTGQQTVMSVELAAGVSGKFKILSTGRGEVQTVPPPVLRPIDTESLHELRYLLDRARHTVERLVAREDRDLFDGGLSRSPRSKR